MDFMVGNKAFNEWGTCQGVCDGCYVIHDIKAGKDEWKKKLIRLTKIIKLYPQRWKGKVIGGFLGLVIGIFSDVSAHGKGAGIVIILVLGTIIGGIMEWLISGKARKI